MKSALAIATHPDDETLGCGGTLLRLKSERSEIHWLIVTSMMESVGFSHQDIAARDAQIDLVCKAYEFDSVTRLGFPSTQLDTIPINNLIAGVREVVELYKPDTLFVPFPGDPHSDHRITFEAVMSCSKTFRAPWVKKILAAEVISETDFGLNPTGDNFKPNVFIDVSKQLDQKIEIMELYKGEMGAFPFPRSQEAIRALSAVRGVQGGCQSAEAFMLLKEII